MNFFQTPSSSPMDIPDGRRCPRMVKLDSVANFRTLGGLPIEKSNRVVKNNMIYRSAAPTYATEEDKCYLLDKLDIVTLIDFRTTYETKNLNFGKRKYEDNFLSFSVRKDSSSEIDRIDRTKEELIMEDFTCFSRFKKIYTGTPRVGARRKSAVGAIRRRFNLPLLNEPYFMEGVYPEAPSFVKLKCKAARYMLPNGLDKVLAYMLMKHLNGMGMFEMYRLTVEFTKREILTVFRIMKCPENYPLSLFCSLGKDRTGIIVALLLSCLGVPREVILEDYHESEIHVLPHKDAIGAYFAKVGLTSEEFVMAPKAVMQRLLEYIDLIYGSITMYLVSIGFSLFEQKVLFEVLTEEKKEEKK